MTAFYSRYNTPPPVRKSFQGVRSKTKQEFAKEADINNLMAKYEQTGLLGKGGEPVPPPRIVDVSNVTTYQAAMNVIVRANTMFGQMSANLRERFHNRPVELLAFLQDESNRKEAEELGLLEKPPQAAQAATTAPATGAGGGTTAPAAPTAPQT